MDHCFNINGTSKPEVKGIKKLLECYKQSLNNIELSSPTLFDPLFTKAKSYAE